MKKNWTIEVDGVFHEVEYKTSAFSAKRKIVVDGVETSYKPAMTENYDIMDIPVMIGDKECRLVHGRGVVDIAVDGIYVNSKEKYEPFEAMPKWTWIFVALCFLILFISVGGAIPAVLAVLGTVGCVRWSTGRHSTFVKVLGCVGITALCWIIWFVMIVAVSAV